jgi:opine dehydrogenase
MTLSVSQSESLLRKAFPSPPPSLTVTICGGGNGAHVAAGYISSKGYTVNVLTRRPDDWNSSILVSTEGSSWASKGVIRGVLSTVSSDPADVIPQSDVVIIAAPAHAHPQLLELIAPHLPASGCSVGALFAQGGFDWAAQKALGTKLSSLHMLFGLQNIPWICKATRYGHEARIIGPKQTLYVTCYPLSRMSAATALMELLFDIPCASVANFLNLTLTPSNQIIHPARYYGIFRVSSISPFPALDKYSKVVQDWDGVRTYSTAELAERKGLTLCRSLPHE